MRAAPGDRIRTKKEILHAPDNRTPPDKFVWIPVGTEGTVVAVDGALLTVNFGEPWGQQTFLNMGKVEVVQSARQSGLYKKYIITHSDQSPVDPGAQYFVLRLDTDPAARQAVRCYAAQIMVDNPAFAKDLIEWIQQFEVS